MTEVAEPNNHSLSTIDSGVQSQEQSIVPVDNIVKTPIEEKSDNDEINEQSPDTSIEEKPLFEQNIKLAEGTTRKRKSTAFLNDELNNQKVANIGPWTAPNGAGSLLQYHTKVAKTIRQMETDKKFEDLKVIYKFLYSGNCKKSDVRARILKFKGLGWSKEDLSKDPDSEETKKLDETDFKHQEMLGAFTNSNLKWAMKTLGIQMPPSKERFVEAKDKEGNVIKDEKTGEPKMVKRSYGPDKDMMIANCMVWLYKPVKYEPPKAPKVVAKKKSEDGKKSGQKRPADDNKNKKSSAESAPKQPKFDLSSVSKQVKEKMSKQSADKENKENKEPAVANNQNGEIPKKKSPPKPSQIKKFIASTLRNANLEDVTMKTVCNAIYDRWPDHREKLIGRKSEIKTWIKEYIANT